MATGLIPNLETPAPPPQPSSTKAEADSTPLQPTYLARLATLPERSEIGSPAEASDPQQGRLEQIEHALTILASVVARLGKEAQQTRLQLRSSEHAPGADEERRALRELVRSMQARLELLEDRLSREHAAVAPPAPAVATAPTPEVAEQLTASLNSIRDSLAALAKRRQRGTAAPE